MIEFMMNLKAIQKNYPVVKFLSNQTLSHQHNLLCKLSPDTIVFLIQSLACILENHPKFKLSKEDRGTAKKILKPHISNRDLQLITSRGAQLKKVAKDIQLQRGRGLFLSVLLSSVIPLIGNLIGKLIHKKKA